MHLLKDKIVKTRVTHRCHGCMRKFQPGSIMNYWTCIDGSDIYSSYTCQTCKEIMQLSARDYPAGFPEAFLADYLPDGGITTPEQYLNFLKSKVFIHIN